MCSKGSPRGGTMAHCGALDRSIVSVACLLLSLPAVLGGEVQMDKLAVPQGFKIELYAKVPQARSLAVSQSSNNSQIVFVGTVGSQVYAVVDDKQGGQRRVFPVTPNLNIPNGVAWRDGDLYVAEIDRILRYPGADGFVLQGKQLPAPVVVSPNLPKQNVGVQDHARRVIRFGPDDRLYVGIGCPCDICKDPCPPFSNLRYCTITSMKPDGSNHTIFASGIRNTVGMDFHPSTGVLYFTENGPNPYGNDAPDDVLDAAPKPGLDFGFSRCYTEGNGDEYLRDPGPGKLKPDASQYGGKNCTGVTPAVQALGPHAAPLGLTFYSGSMFPSEFQGSAFIADHGSYVRTSGLLGYHVVNVRLDEQGRSLSHTQFAWGWLPADGQLISVWGRPMDVQQLPDGSLLVSDDTAHAIYRISYSAAG